MQGSADHDDPHALDGIDFDPHALQRQVGDDARVLAELFALYAETCRAATRELHKALESGQREHAHRQAHKLKSSSSSVGAIALAALCGRIEEGVDGASALQMRALAVELEREGSRALGWILDMARPSDQPD